MPDVLAHSLHIQQAQINIYSFVTLLLATRMNVRSNIYSCLSSVFRRLIREISVSLAAKCSTVTHFPHSLSVSCLVLMRHWWEWVQTEKLQAGKQKHWAAKVKLDCFQVGKEEPKFRKWTGDSFTDWTPQLQLITPGKLLTNKLLLTGAGVGVITTTLLQTHAHVKTDI